MSMYMSSLIGGSSISSTRSRLNLTSFSYYPTSQLASIFLKSKDIASRSTSLRYDPMMRTTRARTFVVRNNITPPPGVPIPPTGSPSGSMRNWIVGIVLTFVLPFVTHKWGPLLVLKNKVDNVVNTAEYLAESIEVVAKKVDNVIDSITDDLPKDSKLRKTLESLDAIVEGVATSAHMADDLIDKAQEVEDKLDSLIRNEVKNDVPKQVDEVPTQEVKDK